MLKYKLESLANQMIDVVVEQAWEEIFIKYPDVKSFAWGQFNLPESRYSCFITREKKANGVILEEKTLSSDIDYFAQSIGTDAMEYLFGVNCWVIIDREKGLYTEDCWDFV